MTTTTPPQPGAAVPDIGVAVDADKVVAVDAKYTGNPMRSPYTGTGFETMRMNALDAFDHEIERYGRVMQDSANPVGRLRIIANTPESLAFLTARARAILGPDVDLVGVLQP